MTLSSDCESEIPRPSLRRWALLGVWGMLVGLPTLSFPFGRDQGNYAYAAWAWLEGAAPYRDVLVFKPPMTVVVHLAAILGFGHSMLSIRYLDLIWQVATAFVLALLASRLAEKRSVGLFAGALYLLLYHQHDFWHTAQTDAFMSLPMLVALLCAQRVGRSELRSRHAGVLSVSAGILFVVAVLFKYTAAALALPALPLLLLQHIPPRRLWTLVIGGAAGAFAMTAAFYLSAVYGGWWDEFLNHQLSALPGYVSQTSTTATFSSSLLARAALQPLAVTLLIGCISLVVHLRDRTSRGFAAFAGVLCFGGLLSCVVQGKFFLYHFHPLVPGAALLGAWGIVSLVSRVTAAGSRTHALVLSTLLLVGYALSPAATHWESAARFAAASSPTEYWTEGRFRNRSYDLGNNLAVAAWLRRNTDANDGVFLWGLDPMINFVAQRHNPTKFIYNYPFLRVDPAAGDVKQLLGQLEDSLPTVFIVATHDAIPHATGNSNDSRAALASFPSLVSFLERNYAYYGTIGRYLVLRRTVGASD